MQNTDNHILSQFHFLFLEKCFLVLWKNDVYFGLLYFKKDDEKLASI